MIPPHASQTAALLAGAALALASALGAARWLGPRGFMDEPRGRHGHARPTPRTGGLALCLTLAVGGLADPATLGLAPEQAVGLLLLAVLGALDDRFGLPARPKAAAGLLVAAAMAAPGAARVVALAPQVDLLGSIPLPPVWPVAFGLLFLLYGFLPQAMNLIDGADGLALGYGLVVLGALAAAGRPLGYCTGALLGLLALNWPRPRHFLGDAGSLALGLLLAFELKRGVGLQDPDFVLWVLAYPIVDMVLVVAIRARNGRPLGAGDRNHLHHQWARRLPGAPGLVVPGLWLQAALCASAVTARGWLWALPVLGLVLLLAQAGTFFVQSTAAPALDALGAEEG